VIDKRPGMRVVDPTDEQRAYTFKLAREQGCTCQPVQAIWIEIEGKGVVAQMYHQLDVRPFCPFALESQGPWN
jgi:hypothetical protein